MTIDESVTLLKAHRTGLKPDDMVKAQSILNQWFSRKWLSPAQENFLAVLAQRAANGGVTARVKSAVGDMGAIMALFDRAKAKLKSPSIVLGDDGGRAYRLTLAGAKARVPGSINVTSNASYDASEWFGRILVTGDFEASPRAVTPPGLVPALKAFAANPAKAAGAHAKATGRCMFCGLPIGEGADPRAAAVGYGEACAASWGLPFPSKADALAQRAALFTFRPKTA